MSSAVNDYASIGKIYREKLGGNPFGIKPDKPRKPLVKCTAHPDCQNMYDPNTQTWSGTCKGYCGE